MKGLFDHYNVIIHVVCFFVAIGVSFLFYSLLVRTKEMKIKWNELYQQLQERNTIHKEDIEKQRREWGEALQLPLTEKVDSLLAYSGLTIKFPWLNGSLFIFSDILLSCGILVLLLLFTHRLNLSCIAGLLLGLIPWIVLRVLSDTQYKATSRDFLTFLRMLSSYAGTYQDVLSLLDAAAQYVKDPIQSRVQMAVVRGRADGNTRLALEWLADNVQYRLFKDLVRALEITSRHSLNYRKIIEEFMSIAEKKNISIQKQRVIIRKGRVGILVMLLLGVIMFFLVVITVNGNNNLIEGLQIFLNNIVGRFILFYMAAVVFGAVWYTFFQMRSE